MNKKLFAVIGIPLVLALLAGCSTQKEEAGQTELRIAMSGQYPPFNYFDDNNNLVGFDVDISTEVARRLDMKPELITTAWDGIIAGLLADKYDLIIGSMAITPERLKSVDFSDPYYTSGAQVFGHKGTKMTGPEDLAGKTVGVTQGTTYEVEVKKIKGIKKVSTYDGPPLMYMEMKNKRIDAFVTDRLVGLNGIKKSGYDFVLVGPPMYKEEMGIAIRKGRDDLLSSINEALAAMKEDGTYKEISEKWFGRDISEGE